ncbi:MAG: lipoyl(octanoyl) transferase LipB [Candidatus Sumerlaeaceae bacterium]
MSYLSQTSPLTPVEAPDPFFWGENIPYKLALSRLATVHDLRKASQIEDQFFYLTHEPVITYGRATTASHLSMRPHHIPTIEVPRGGLATYHGPGQLIGYIVLDLTQRARNQRPDIHAYLRAIEDGLISFLQSEFHLPATRRQDCTGVWTTGFPPQRHRGKEEKNTELLSTMPRKLASIGVSARKWITSHGFALNLHPDMDAFKCIVPCGITDAEMTSVEQEHVRAGRSYRHAQMHEVAERVHMHIIAALQQHGWCLTDDSASGQVSV